MNYLPDDILKKANESAIYTLYLYLAHITTPAEDATLQSIVSDLEFNLKKQKTYTWNSRDVYRLSILINAVKYNPFLANSKISNLTTSRSGLTACSFTNQNGKIFVVFKGTGKGEWIDNGEGLSGIPKENTYITYNNNGRVADIEYIQNDYATDQQVEALNWFNKILARNSWGTHTKITVSGHSKGGNKAQFITANSDVVNACYSFDGQGFSPEALLSLSKRYKTKLDERRKKIYSMSSENDYINVLGCRLMPENNIYFFDSFAGFHYLETMLDNYGRFHSQCEQGKLSEYVQTVSEKLMALTPDVRQKATLGIMNIFQQILGEGSPVNDDDVSIEKTVAGLAVAVKLLLEKD